MNTDKPKTLLEVFTDPQKTDEVTIRLDYIPKTSELSLNKRTGIYGSRPAEKKAKEEAYYACISSGIPEEPFEQASLHVTFRSKNKKWPRVDIDNLNSTMKYFIDGFVQAGVLPDDSVKHLRETHSEYEILAETNETIITMKRM